MKNFIMPVVRMTIVLLLICGLLYPLAVTGISQVVMTDKANGSLLYNEKHEVIGSTLIGQTFKDAKYFQGRVSSINNDGGASGSNNYAPSNPDFKKRVDESIAAITKENPTVQTNKIPVDLITNSGSGLDPDITPDAAYIQIERIAKATGLSKDTLNELVKKNTRNPVLGFFGEKRVNVLQLNIALDQQLKHQSS